jgi:hypothetical protein
MDDWLLFLGAGASVAAPTRLPLFLQLAAGILQGMGWQPGELEGEPVWIHSRYPPFSQPDLSAEVLFGALRRFGVRFTGQLAELFQDVDPNVVHHVAASVLATGGCVWTTNVDVAVEAACERQGVALGLAGRAADRAPELMQPLRSATAGTYVKLHGTAAAPATMAFTDRELISPLAMEDIEHLGALADGRTMVVYGYAGADADLADLLDEALRRAGRVIWHEPFDRARQEIVRAFRHAERIEFRPALSGEPSVDLQASAREFIAFAEEAGALIPPADANGFARVEPLPGAPEIALDEPPGIAQARLVERFGRPSTHGDALRAARVDDLLAHRRETLEGHFRWTLSRSLYNAGAIADLVGWLADHKAVLARVRPRAMRDYFITRASALRLRDGGWQALDEFSNWAIATRARPDGTPYPSDLYYRAQARRYQLRPALARRDADAAARGLSDEAVTDPERLAGALLESGMAAVYMGRFEAALARGFDLQFRRGRYAIQVWRGWGAWLQAIAFCHLQRPEDAARELEEVERRFRADGRGVLLADLHTARLLRLRIVMALGKPVDDELLAEARATKATGRYRDDLDLILADLAIAQGELQDARERLDRIHGHPASPLGAAMADLGLAELERLAGATGLASEQFSALAHRCRERGANWLEAQALLGVRLCGDPDSEGRWSDLRRELSPTAAHDGSLESLAVGDPRVLWLLTV